MYVLPQEIEVWYIIPAIRKEFAKQFVKEHKLSYEKAGNILGISKAAVSQYISNKRANKFTLPEAIKKEIQKSSKVIAKDHKQAVFEILRILDIIKKKKYACGVCRRYNPEIKQYCDCNPFC